MPLLDVSDILSDPDFADSAIVTRTAVANDTATGRTIRVPTDIPISVVYTSDKGQSLRRNPEAAISEGSVMFHSTFRFTDGGDGLDADIVTFLGRQWTVVSVDDYSRYGAGFTVATCRLLDLR